jgi:hypothetical protein
MTQIGISSVNFGVTRHVLGSATQGIDCFALFPPTVMGKGFCDDLKSEAILQHLAQTCTMTG